MMIERVFVKYQSLGNDIILFDWRANPRNTTLETIARQDWPFYAAAVCDRHYGIGADIVIVLSDSLKASIPEIFIFNSDGSRAEMCLNGLRCVGDYLLSDGRTEKRVWIQVGERQCECRKIGSEIVTMAGPIKCLDVRELHISGKIVSGTVVSIGNPHFVIFDESTVEWLAAHGKKIESHSLFPNRTNVEFVWKPSSNGIYQLLTYERGGGLTLSCSSGAAAVTGLLQRREEILPLQKIEIRMLGGSVHSWVDGESNIILQAKACRVFAGRLESANE
jgi:diaminopimelate epimerase